MSGTLAVATNTTNEPGPKRFETSDLPAFLIPGASSDDVTSTCSTTFGHEVIDAKVGDDRWPIPFSSGLYRTKTGRRRPWSPLTSLEVAIPPPHPSVRLD
ncbi:hypothetical protein CHINAEXTREME_08730 [Halobiforma lacisalsi AJ5]|uniref:Uncharacterized protein n=1 Tax=Natronobacterium lacisalsi AJ5 TaxID=358396 RepID=M0L6A4_NATLA|nr:hypothetical protein [Halobiforma lacisalsi]APW97859.1 hypothetical protein CHINAEXTREME_08730 [Halobiforma lacisalsi AJ5]EMA29127.1 hypothetical protein C445_17304 [Halobiforma lacisalsi AJ5]